MSSRAWDASDAWWHADGSEWWYKGWSDQSAAEYRTDGMPTKRGRSRQEHLVRQVQSEA